MLADAMGLPAAAEPAQPVLPPGQQNAPIAVPASADGQQLVQSNAELLNKVINRPPSRGGPRLHYIVSLTPNAPSEAPARPSIRAAQPEAPAAPAPSGDGSDALRSIQARLRQRKH